jgi:tetratricopeptide (TPR) repeat protein
MAEPQSDVQAKVFISYSRKDFELISTLVDALSARDGIDVFRDTDDILPTEEWQGRLAELIAESDTVVFALSPHSIASQVCRWEIDEAERLNKRFAPIVIADVEPASIPASLSKYNYIFFNRPGEFDKALENLVAALNTDIDWIREHTRLGALARRWAAQRGKGAQPLRGGELADAEAWLAGQPPNAPPPTALHREFVHASRAAATRRQRNWLGGSVAAMAVMAVLTVYAFQQRNIAIDNEQRANVERDRAESNLEQALDATDTMVVQIAEGMKDITGVPIEFTRSILEKAEAVLSGLKETGGAAEIRHRQAIMLISFVRAYETLGDLDEAAARAGRALELMQGLAAEQPTNPDYLDELVAAHDKNGDVMVARGNFGGALGHYRASLAIAEAELTKDAQSAKWRHAAGLSHGAIGDAFKLQGRLGEALAEYETSHAILAETAASDAANTDWQRDLSLSHNKIADVLRDQGNLDGALERYRTSLDIIERLAAAAPRNAGLRFQLVIRHERIGDVLMAQGRFDDALAAYQARHTIISALADTDPKNATWQRDLSVSHERIGEVQGLQDKGQEALASFQASLEIRLRLAARDETNTQWQRDVSVSHNKLGDLHHQEQRLDEALESYRAALVIREALAAQDPDHPGWQRDLAATHDRIGNVYFAQRDFAGALASYQASLAVAAALAASDPQNAGWQRDLAVVHNRIGSVHAELGDAAAALESFGASLAIAERMVVMDVTNTQWQIDLVISHLNLARLGEAAETHWRAVVEILGALDDQDRLSAVHKQWLMIAEANLAVLTRQ